MKVCDTYYTGSKGVYAKAIPSYRSSHVLEEIIYHTNPPFDTHGVPYNSHVTLMCSNDLPRTVKLNYPKESIVSRITKIEHWCNNHVGYAVALLDSTQTLMHIHRLFQQVGAVHKYGSYIPHLTLGMDIGPPTPLLRNWINRVNVYLRQTSQIIVLNRLLIRDNKF